VKLNLQVKEHKIEANFDQPLIHIEAPKDEPKQYFHRAMINALVGVPLILFSSFIPLPLTLTGQLIDY